ncbi:hypothetical protein Dimus_020276 [Dionaea muscipula]
MHIVACKELYANLTMYHYKKKEVARSRVRGVEIEFDSMRLALIFGVPDKNGICEYIKKVWEESKYIKPLEITRKFANDELINGEEPKRRRDNEAGEVDNDVPAENVEENFHLEVMIDEVELQEEDVNEEADQIQGESGSAEKFYDAEDEVQGSEDVIEEVPAVQQKETSASVQQKETSASGVDPSTPTGSIPDSFFIPLQAEFERARVDRIPEDLERAHAENARFLSLLQQAKAQPK